MLKRVGTVWMCSAFLLATGVLAVAADDPKPQDRPKAVKPATDAKAKVKTPAKKPTTTSDRDKASAVGFGPYGAGEEPWQARPNPVDAKDVKGAASTKKAAQAPEKPRKAQQAPAR